MGTRWSVRLAARAVPAGLERAIENALAGIVAEMSQWEPDSHLSRFNRAVPGWVVLPRDLMRVLGHGLRIAELSSGAFDPAIGALSELWGFGAAPAACAPPDPVALAEARVRGGWRKLALDLETGRARQPGGLALDLAGIAKGFAVDRIGEVVKAHDCRDFLAEIGGELVGRGINPDGQPWWVAIEAPPGAHLPPTRIALHGQAVATSGNHRRFFDHGGRRYAHSIDPRTGAPLDNNIASVTVLRDTCLDADALATALTVLGLEDGLTFATRHDIAALFVVECAGGFEEHLSPALAALAG